MEWNQSELPDPNKCPARVCVCVCIFPPSKWGWLKILVSHNKIYMFQINHWFSNTWDKSVWFQFVSFFSLRFKMKSSVFFTTCPVSRSMSPAWAKFLKWGNLFHLVSTVSSSPHPTGDSAHREGGWSEPTEVGQMEKVHYRQQQQFKRLSHIRMTRSTLGESDYGIRATFWLFRNIMWNC